MTPSDERPGSTPGRTDGTDQDPTGADVAAVVRAQHGQAVTLVEAVNGSSGTERRQALGALLAFLARHEAAEELAIHPVTVAVEPAGADIGGQLVTAEESMTQQVERLESFDVDSFEFTKELPLMHSSMTSEQAGAALRVLGAVENDAVPDEPGTFATQLEKARDRYRALVGT